MQNSQDKGQIIRKEEEQHLEKLHSKLDSKRIMYIIPVFMGHCFGCQVPRVSKRLCTSKVSSEFRGKVSKNFCKDLDSICDFANCMSSVASAQFWLQPKSSHR